MLADYWLKLSLPFHAIHQMTSGAAYASLLKVDIFSCNGGPHLFKIGENLNIGRVGLPSSP